MCRKTEALRIALLAAGVGALLAVLLGGSAWSVLLGIGLLAAGLLIGFRR